MTLARPLWLTAGVVVGGLHAAWRWQAACRASSMRPAIGRVRLLGVAVVLVGAALAGSVLAVCLGWGVGVWGCTGLALRRSKAP